jgi:hypothetical protein
MGVALRSTIKARSAASHASRICVAALVKMSTPSSGLGAGAGDTEEKGGQVTGREGEGHWERRGGGHLFSSERRFDKHMIKENAGV